MTRRHSLLRRASNNRDDAGDTVRPPVTWYPRPYGNLFSQIDVCSRLVQQILHADSDFREKLGGSQDQQWTH